MQRQGTSHAAAIVVVLCTFLLGLAGIAAPAAQAQQGNVVVFGDSFPANPDQHRNRIAKIPGSSNLPYIADYPRTGNCIQGPDNYPRQLGLITGYDVRDWSCSGIASRHMMKRVDMPIEAGDLNPGTRAVVLAVGFNDFWPTGLHEIGPGFDPGRIHDEYAANMRAVAARIRTVAPYTKLIMPGMLSISEPYGLNSVCVLNVVPNVPLGVPLPLLQDVESWVRDNQEDAAREIGAHFIDIKSQTTGNNTCARDRDRWVSGYVDTTTAHYQMPFHPARAGSIYVAQQIAQVL
ncbi:esterase [Corynebacterium aquatimens]|uniref:GDSL-type esterase/lipase family protein n=1 Tax=Corynebacterium TaxID=1716 RepID=UPI001F263202|nr:MULTISPECIES: GDSL-type esterase/lipase family protein [Corynebacterium]QYH20006.1 esterase [Corynebacterium aquatimens]UIZ92803.1 esterase [Corynebacterium sp. CNCTC7651]